MRKLKFSLLVLIGLVSGMLFISCDSSTESEEVNTAPIANFTVSPDSGIVPTEFSFDASSSSDTEDEAENLLVRWDFDNDGNFETAWATEKTATYKYDAIGIYSVKLEVKDSGGLISEKVKTVIVNEIPNTAPKANFTISPDTGTTETIFTFDASSSFDLQDDVENLWVRWDFNNDGNFETDWSKEKVATHQYSLAERYLVKLEVKDSGGLIGSEINYLLVYEPEPENTAPVANFTVNPESGTVETEFLFDASSSSDAEDENEALEVRWDFDNDGNFEIDWTTEKTATYKYAVTGSYMVKLEVKDSGGLVSEKVGEIIVDEIANTAPVANFTISPETGTVETEFLFDASSSSDAEDGAEDLLVRWDFNNDGNFETDWTTEKTATHKYSVTGSYSIKLEVKDSGEMSASLVKNLVVVENSAPEGMVLIEGGSFEMGNVLADPNGYDDEDPVHTVNINSFYMGQYEVTNAEYCEFLNEVGNQEEGGSPWLDLNDSDCQIEEVSGTFASKPGKENYPVILVTWYGANAYAEWKGGRLPTEAEWEYAARGGNLANGYKYAGSDELDEVAWYDENSQNPDNDMSDGRGSQLVGQKLPNELGLYDMSGNVFEWCKDWYDGDYYSNSPSDNPQGANTGSYRVLRGGSWNFIGNFCRVSARNYTRPEYSLNDYGFRLVIDQ